MQDVAEVLSPLAIATELLTTESQPAAGMMYYLLHELVSQDLCVFERPGAQDHDDDSDSDTEIPDDVSESEFDSPVAAKLKHHISKRLRDRFNLSEDGQPDIEVCRTCPLLVSAFCDPR